MSKYSKWAIALAQNTISRLDRNQETLKTFLDQDYIFSIANTRLVASRSLLANCDVRSSVPASSVVDIDYLNTVAEKVNLLGRRDRPASVYVCSDGLEYFANSVLPEIKIPFILVSGDSDLSISEKNLGPTFDVIADHPLLVSWFAQNKDTQHLKLHTLPIGLDFHSRWRDVQIWGGGFILPAMQEAELRHLLLHAPEWSDRKVKAYCNWGVSADRGDRQECKRKMDPQAYYYQNKRLSRTDTLMEQTQYAFVTSPSGAGTDCHRTWEALSLGCVPIVKRSNMVDVFEGLPVLIVDDWSQVTPLFLQQQAERFQGRVFDYSKLLLHYWVCRIQMGETSTNFSTLKCSLDQFRGIVL